MLVSSPASSRRALRILIVTADRDAGASSAASRPAAGPREGRLPRMRSATKEQPRNRPGGGRREGAHMTVTLELSLEEARLLREHLARHIAEVDHELVHTEQRQMRHALAAD